MTENIDYSVLPESCRAGMRRWIEQGIEPGSFLCAVIRNDLAQAFAFADDDNIRLMASFAAFLRGEAPSACWGSQEKMDAWKQLRTEARTA